MKTIAFIPIKLSSQRLPHKNILPLNNKPLCWYIFDTALKCKEIDEVYVFCSDESIMDYIPSEVHFIKRDPSLDSNYTKGIDIYRSFISLVDADIYVLMHATSPFLKAISVDKALANIKNGPYDSAFSAKRIQTFVWFKGQPLNYDVYDIPRTQDIDYIIVETSGFYAFSKSVIENGRRIGDKPFILEVDFKEAIDIDEREDYDQANLIIKLEKESNPN